MPRKTKETIENVENDDIKKVATKKSTTSKKAKSDKTTTKKASATSKKASVKKDETKKASSKTATKKTTKSTKTEKTPVKKAVSKTTKKETKPKTAVKKSTTKKVVTKSEKATVKKTTSKTTTKKAISKATKTKKVEILEYYDLPYKYNETIVKILAQTPTTLFVYWDISDEDKNNFIKQYGEYFFNNTKPVLVIHNTTKNYSFKVDINDFANSWYLQVEDSDCDYKIELGRRPINTYVSIPNNYLYVSSSNSLKSPNDHILFEKMPNTILFKNVKTNEITEKAIMHYLVKIQNTYNIKEFYKEMYKDENIDFDKLTLNNPSSSSTFK